MPRIKKKLSVSQRLQRAITEKYFLVSLALGGLFIWLVWHGIENFDYRWRWARASRHFIKKSDGEWVLGPLFNGLLTTLEISFYAIVISTIIAIVLTVMRLSLKHSLRFISLMYVNFMRSTPLLVQLYLLYFMLGNVIGLERFQSGVLALALFEAAFIAEIFRSSVINVSQNYIDAAKALGLTKLQTWRFVIVPRALPLILPALANTFVGLIKHSSIITIVAINDLTDVARNLISETFLVLEIWFIVGGLYLIICFPLAWLIKKWEYRLLKRVDSQ